MRRIIEIAVLLAVSLVAALAVHAWLASRDEQQRLASALATQKQILDSATARESTRDATLDAALAQIDKLKRNTQTPEQIVRDLPKYLPLPQPIALVGLQASAASSPSPGITGSEKGTGASERQGTGASEKPPAPCRTPSAQSRSGSKTDRLTGSRIEAGMKRKLGRATAGEKSSADCHAPSGQLRADASATQSDASAVQNGAHRASDRAGGSSSIFSASSAAPDSSNPSSLSNDPQAVQRGTRTSQPVPRASDSSDSSRQSSPLSPDLPDDHLDQNGTRASQSIDPAASCPKLDSCAAQIPAADLKPLYDYVQDCRACQAQLAVANQNSADDALKIAALTRERDAAITAAKGGSFLRRLRRNALWFAVGATVGFAAAKR